MRNHGKRIAEAHGRVQGEGRRVLQGGEPDATYAEIAREPGCGAGSLSHWVKTAGGGQPDEADMNPFQMREENRRLKRELARLKEENEILFKSQRLLREQAAVRETKFGFIGRHLDEHGVSAMCRALKVTRQAYYQWAARFRRARPARSGNRMRAAHRPIASENPRAKRQRQPPTPKLQKRAQQQRSAVQHMPAPRFASSIR